MIFVHSLGIRRGALVPVKVYHVLIVASTQKSRLLLVFEILLEVLSKPHLLVLADAWPGLASARLD